MPFKMHKIIFFSRKKNEKKYVCLPYLKFSDPLPKTYLFFLFGLMQICEDVPDTIMHGYSTILAGLQIRVHNQKIIFLFLNQNICCGKKNRLNESVSKSHPH